MASAELERAVAAGLMFGVGAPLCHALVSLAEIRALERARPAAREPAGEARELAASSGVPPNTMARLDALDQLLDRTAQRTAVGSGALVEELTDRELSILRARQGNLSLRELGAELYLSHNPVKGYPRILHRKLGAHTRANAGARGRDLDPI